MTDPRRISDVMLADPDWRKLLGKRRPKSLHVPWPEHVVDHLPTGVDVEIVKVRGPAREHQCWQALALYEQGDTIPAIAGKLSIAEDVAASWVLQAMGAR